MAKQKYVSLHNHTEHSLLDGKGTIKDYVARAKQLGMPALAITDHGTLSGSWEFYTECLANGIEPILGSEMYFVPNAQDVKDEKVGERFHISILARNEAGFATLVEMNNASHHQFYYKPIIDRPLIEGLSKADRKNLVVLSGCAGSIISRKAVGGVEGDVHEELMWWRRQFRNFYIELMHHDTSIDRKLNKRLLKLAGRHDLPWVVTNDPHYVLKEECEHHDALLAIQTSSNLDDEDRFRFDGSGYHLRSAREMARAFSAYGDEVWKPGAQASLDIAKTCKLRIPSWDARSWHIPKFPGCDDAQGELKRLAYRGLRERGLADNEEYVARLKHELKEFRKVGMADFLLITADAIREAKKRGIRVGPGRGSVCGTLVGYLIGIHKIDPIRYNLLFERFLNPERPKMPDIDTDFQRSRRHEMFTYTDELYGEENTMRVGAFQRFKTLAAWKSLAMAYGVPFQAANAISKQILEDEEGDAVLPPDVELAYPELHATLKAFRGLRRGLQRHPAGVIIFDPHDPIQKLIPEMRVSDKSGKNINYVSQFDLDVAAGLGLLKQDFLGLRTLDTIEECVKLVKERYGEVIEPDDWIPGEEEGDKYVWKMLREGKTAGVFQMEGGANHRGIQEIRCGEFEDIVSCTSLYRAGPMIAGAPKRYLENKKDKKIRVAHKSMEPYLRNSWGEMIYQEQMFEILRNLADFSWARVDDAKTAMTKKDAAKMEAIHSDAIKGFQEVSGMSEAKAEEVWEMIAAQASYLFNRSHAVAYSFLTYQTARLKYLYPLEFLAALLRTVEPKNDADKGKRESYMTEALSMNFKIMPPDVNISDDRFMPNGDDELLFGLVDIKGVGESAVQKMMKARRKIRKKRDRDFRSVDEVADAVNNKGVVKALAAAGALRSLGVEPEVALQEELLRWQFTDPVKPYRKKYRKKIKYPKRDNSWAVLVGEITKTEKSKTKNGLDYMRWTIRCEPGIEYRITLWSEMEEYFKLGKGSIVLLQGKYSAQWSNIGISDPSDVRVLVKSVSLDKTKKEKAS